MQFGGVLTGIPLAVAVMYLLRRLFQRKLVNLHGKVVLITGASSGVGEACAHAFHKAGAKVILCARRLAELERVANDILTKYKVEDKSLSPEVVQLNLSDQEDIKAKVETIIGAFGKVDVLINNAGISSRGSVLDTQMEVFEKLMSINFLGHVALTKALLPGMIVQKKGTIVEVSSTQGKIAIPHRAPYSASKHAAQAFFDSLRAEVADDGVNVCVISPGYIATNLSKNAVTSDGTSHGELDNTTAGGMSPDYVAEQVVAAVEYGEKEVILDTLKHKAAIYIRTLSPWLFFYIMQKRALSSKKTS